LYLLACLLNLLKFVQFVYKLVSRMNSRFFYTYRVLIFGLLPVGLILLMSVSVFAGSGHTVLPGITVFINKHVNKLAGKHVALLTNPSGVDENLVLSADILFNHPQVNLVAFFAPEHGFFGDISAGQKIDDQSVEDLPTIYSLYGKTRKPTPVMLEGLDLIIYDIQDVGARFYTYISTLGLIMEAAGEAGIPVIVLDRPNPLGGKKVEGPVLNLDFKSFVGMYPIPIRYGLTVGELAKMIIGEKWISAIPDLTVIEMEGWNRQMDFDNTGLPWINPSPNIPDLETAFLYPGMALIEAIPIVSEGRGTEQPFKWIGAPWIDGEKFAKRMNNAKLPGIAFEPVSFIPVSIKGKAISPKFVNEQCNGIKCTITDFESFKPVYTGLTTIRALNEMYQGEKIGQTLKFNEQYLTKLFGDSIIYEIFFSPNPDAYYDRKYKILLNNYEKIMEKYLLYD